MGAEAQCSNSHIWAIESPERAHVGHRLKKKSPLLALFLDYAPVVNGQSLSLKDVWGMFSPKFGKCRPCQAWQACGMEGPIPSRKLSLPFTGMQLENKSQDNVKGALLFGKKDPFPYGDGVLLPGGGH